MAAPMLGVLYYGRTCTHSQELLRLVAQQGISERLRFVPVDQREQRGDKMFALLPNGTRVLIPEGVKAVPAFLDIRDKNVYVGPEVGRRLGAEAERAARLATGAEKEPMAFSDISTGDSSTFSYFSDDPEALLAKGSGGTEIPSAFAAHDQDIRIKTGEADGEGEKGVTSADYDAYMAQRELGMPTGQAPPPGSTLPPPQKV